MFHKTLISYHNNEPLDNGEEHPDGPFWPVTPDEIDYVLPEGLRLEHVYGGSVVIGKNGFGGEVTESGYLPYGLRGW